MLGLAKEFLLLDDGKRMDGGALRIIIMLITVIM